MILFVIKALCKKKVSNEMQDKSLHHYFTITILILLYTLRYTDVVDAKTANVLQDCVTVNSSTYNQSESKFDVGSLNEKKYCSTRCKDFMLKTKIDGQNQDLVTSCKEHCLQYQEDTKNPQAYSARKRLENKFEKSGTFDGKAVTIPLSSYPYAESVTNVSFKSDEANSISEQSDTNEQFTRINIGQNQVITLSLDTSVKNTIYACGHRVLKIDPVFPNLFKMSPESVAGGNAAENAYNNMHDDKKTNIQTILEYYTRFTTFSFDEYVKVEGMHENDSPSTIYNNILKLKKRNTDETNKSLKAMGVYNDIDIEKIYKYKNNEKLSVDISGIMEWPSEQKKYHPCFTYLDNTNAITNSEIMSCDGENITGCKLIQSIKDKPDKSSINIKNYPQDVGCYPQWHIYNRQYLNTGITISDGDFLKISWGGDMILGNGLTIPFFNQAIAKIAAAHGGMKVWPFEKFSRNTNLARINTKQLLRDMSTLDIKGLGLLIGEDGIEPKSDQNQGQKPELCGGKLMSDIKGGNTSKEYYGLQGLIMRNNAISYEQSYQCNNISMGADRYEFSGRVANVQKQQLEIRHYIPDSNSPNRYIYDNSPTIIGGSQVSIEWGGCPMYDGEGLEYALESNSTNGNFEWKTTNLNTGNELIFAPENTKIKPASNIITLDNNIKSILLRVNPYDKHAGRRITQADSSYSVVVRTGDAMMENNDDYNILKKISLVIFSTLIGDIEKIVNEGKFDGVVVELARAIFKNLAYIIHGCVVLYVAFTGLGFMLGTIKMNQHEMLMRILKLTIVALIVSQTVQDLFIKNFLRTFIIGVLQISSRVQYEFYSIVGTVNSGPYEPENYFNYWDMTGGLIAAMTSHGTGYRILALIISNIFGLFTALVMVASFVIVFVMIIQSAFLFISAMITQSMLLLIAPWFIAMKLFAATKDMFDTWFKQVVYFAVLPVGVVITTSLMFLLIRHTMDAMLGFSYCTKCFLKLSFIVDKCIIPLAYLLNNSFVPDEAMSLLPTGIVAAVFTFALLAFTGWYIIAYVVRMLSYIVAFKAEAYGKGSTTGLFSAMSEDIAGMKQKGAQYMYERASKQKYETKKRLDDIGRALDRF